MVFRTNETKTKRKENFTASLENSTSQVFIMSQLRVFSLIGDSNIRNHVNKNSCRANPSLKGTQVLSCGHLEIFSTTLSKIRQESTVCILSCVTNFLTGAEGPPTVSQRVDPVLQDLREALFQACSDNPARSYLVSPPMYRSRPLWYREGLPEILTLFSQTMSQDRPDNLYLLPSFATPDFEADGVHLTAYSGLEFISHLFDSAVERLDTSDLPLEVKASMGSESTRVLEDRMMALEQDHRRLNRVVESKTAEDAELADFHINERQKDFFVIEGLECISGDLVGKAWQVQALKDVDAALLLLMGRQMTIVFVKNSTGRHEGAIVTYNVQMSTVADSEAIRKKAGSYFLTGRDERPKEIRHFSIKNLLTPESKTRISVLKLLAQRYRDSNPGSKVKVIGYQSRPTLKIVPAQTASDRRVQVYNYVEAVRSLPCSFSTSELEPIMRRINPKLVGKIRSIFVILSDDYFRKRTAGSGSRPANQASEATEASDSAPNKEETTESEELPTAPPPSRTSSTSSRSSQAPPASTRGAGRGSGKGSGRGSDRGEKRGAESSPGADAPAKR